MSHTSCQVIGGVVNYNHKDFPDNFADCREISPDNDRKCHPDKYPQLSSSSIWARAWKLLLSMTINKYNWRVWSTGILCRYLFLPEADHRKLFIGDNKLSCLIKSETVTATHNQHHEPASQQYLYPCHYSTHNDDSTGLDYHTNCWDVIGNYQYYYY